MTFLNILLFKHFHQNIYKWTSCLQQYKQYVAIMCSYSSEKLVKNSGEKFEVTQFFLNKSTYEYNEYFFTDSVK